MNHFTREFTPKTNKPYLTKTLIVNIFYSFKIVIQILT